MVSVVHGAPRPLRIYLGIQSGGITFEFRRLEVSGIPHVSLASRNRNFEKSKFP